MFKYLFNKKAWKRINEKEKNILGLAYFPFPNYYYKSQIAIEIMILATISFGIAFFAWIVSTL